MYRGKFLGPNHVEFWKLRFDPERHLTLDQVEAESEISRDYFREARRKLAFNIKHGFLTPQDIELIQLAQKVTELEGAITEQLLDMVIRKRALQVHWERTRQRLLQRKEIY